MPRDARAYLSDILESCDAIVANLEGINLESYEGNRLIRSAVEREFTIIGEAMLAISHRVPETFAKITRARRIIDFRNQLTHEYANVNDALVWAIADRDIPVLRQECTSLLEQLTASDSSV